MDDALLNRLSARARADSAFLANVLARYTQAGGPVAGSLREHLRLTPRDFQRLGLYLRPRPDHFEEDVRTTANDFNIDPHQLAAVVRFVDAFDAMADSGDDTIRLPPPNIEAGFLAAARERKSPPSGKNDRPSEKQGDV